MKWGSVETAIFYRLEISTHKDFKTFVVQEITEETYYDWKFDKVGTYFWHVYALDKDKNISSKTSKIARVDIEFLSPPLMDSEKNIEIDPDDSEGESPESIAFQWKGHKDITQYEFQYATNKAFKKRKVFYTPTTSKEILLTKFKPGKTYYWRVRAVNTKKHPLSTFSNIGIVKIKLKYKKPPPQPIKEAKKEKEWNPKWQLKFLAGPGIGILNLDQSTSFVDNSLKSGSGSGVAPYSLYLEMEYWPLASWWGMEAGISWVKGKISFNSTGFGSASLGIQKLEWFVAGKAQFQLPWAMTLQGSAGLIQFPQYYANYSSSAFSMITQKPYQVRESIIVFRKFFSYVVGLGLQFLQPVSGFPKAGSLQPFLKASTSLGFYEVGVFYEFGLNRYQIPLTNATQSLKIKNTNHRIQFFASISFENFY